MESINDLINDLPQGLDDGSDTGAGHTATTVVDNPDDTVVDDDTEAVEDQETEEEVQEDDETEEDEDTNPDDKGGKATDEEDEDDQSQYLSDSDDDEDTTPTDNTAVVTAAKEITKQTQDEYVLAGLQKITVRVIGPDDKIYTIQAYGNGDLPSDMKDFASKAEEKAWDGKVIDQNAKARDLISKYQQAQELVKATDAQNDWVRKENMAIRDDLNDLIKEAIFPKFKGEPGTKEFEDSAGGKEFSRVIKYMNERNEQYRQRGNSGKAYRHIGFYEAFMMLNGPNSKSAEKNEDKARKTVAKKLRSGGGTTTKTTSVSTTPVTNLTDLADEFSAFAGSTK